MLVLLFADKLYVLSSLYHGILLRSDSSNKKLRGVKHTVQCVQAKQGHVLQQSLFLSEHSRLELQIRENVNLVRD